MNFSTHAILAAFTLTLLAGLSTGIGSVIAFLSHETNKRFLSIALGFSAGVMIYISFVELLPAARTSLEETINMRCATIITTIAFFVGIAIIAIIDKIIPSGENPHEVKSLDNARTPRLARTGLLYAIAIPIHNFPEGIATFISGLSDPAIAYPVAFAIALHNIPEGIAVSIPVFFATGSRRKAFLYSFLSGLAEPVGAIAGFFLITTFIGIPPLLPGILLALVAGIMVFISLDELLPTAEAYGAHHLSIYGLLSGMTIIAISLLLAT